MYKTTFHLKKQIWYKAAIIFLLFSSAFHGRLSAQALNFNAGSRVSIPYPDALASASGFTIEFWMKTTQTGSRSDYWYSASGLVEADYPFVTNDFGVSLNGSKVIFGIGNPDISINSTSDVNTGEWVHVAATWTSTNGEMKLYINGRLEATKVSGATRLRTAPVSITLGVAQSSGQIYNGAMDEVRIWKTVLSQTQIQNQLYCTPSPASDLVLYYDFNEGTPEGDNTALTTISDRSGNGVDGTLNYFTLTGTASNFVANAILEPTASITANSEASIVAGKEVTFTANVANAGSAPTYQWIKNGSDIPGATGLTYTTTELANNDEISFRVTPSSGCYNTPVTSSAIRMEVLTLSVRYVRPTSTGLGDGRDWANASDDLQQAMIDAAADGGGQVWVAKGTYRPIRMAGDGGQNRDKAFVLGKDVKVYGGFAGTERSPDQRDLSDPANESILSGDLDNNDIVTGSGPMLSISNNTENAYHVVISAGDVGTAELNGFTISAGRSPGNVGRQGPIVNSILIDRRYGAGMYIEKSSPLIAHCTISGGTSENETTSMGGGMYMREATPVITDCVFSGNQGNFGAGLASEFSSPTITNTIFWGNVAEADDGIGGGVYLSQGQYVESSGLTLPILLTNCTFWGNEVGDRGGAIFAEGPSTNLTLTNNILAGNTAGEGNSLGMSFSSMIIDANHNLIEGGYAGTGNIDADPLFADAASGDFRLMAGSPALDKGNNAGVASSNTTDIAGAKRIQGAAVDMGAYEALPLTLALNNATNAGGNDGKITATVAGGTEPYQYHWSNGASTAIIENLVAGVYTLTVTDAAGAVALAKATITSIPPPVINSATYDLVSGDLVVTGANLLALSGSNNDIAAKKFTFIGEGGAGYSLSSTPDVEISSATSFTLKVDSADRGGLVPFLKKNGTVSRDGTVYNLAAAEDWDAGADAPVIIADLTGNGITVSGVDETPPTVVSFVRQDVNPSNRTSFTYRITFSEPVSGINATDFTFVPSAGISASGIRVTPISGTTCDITVGTVIGTGTLGINLNDSGTGIMDPSENLCEEGFIGEVYTVDQTPPTITDGHISLSGATGIGGAYRIGDTVTVSWDDTEETGDKNGDIDSVTVDFSAFGGDSAVNARDSSGIWKATYTIVSGSIDGINKNVSVRATDNAGNVTTRADGTNAIVDNIAPVITKENISISGASGTGGIYRVGDIVTATWNDGPSGNNNSDGISAVTVDFRAFGGDSATVASNTSGTWKATYRIVAGDIDGTDRNVTFIVTDNAGNRASATGDTNATVNNIAPKVTEEHISISGARGTNGAYKTGDVVTATWNNTTSGDNNGDISEVMVDFSAFGGGAAVTATNTSGIWKATYTIEAGSIDGTDRNVSVTATNTVGNATETADSTNAVVDNIAPTVTKGKISISGSSGTDGAYKIGDIVTATWDNTVSGDNNSDMDSVMVDFSAFGGEAVPAANTSGKWTATYTIAAGSIDGTDLNVSVTATDDVGNATMTTDDTNATVDNIAPVVTAAKISISGASGTDGAYKTGDEVTAIWDNTASGDHNSDMDSVTVDFRAFGGGIAVPATNTSGKWKATYTIIAGGIDGTDINVSVTAKDDAGNATTTTDDTNATVDNIAPVVTEENIVISGASGTDGAYKIGDEVTAVWDNTATGDSNSDVISGVTVDFTAFGGGIAVPAANTSGKWKATYTIIAGGIDGTDINVSVTATDDVGNAITTTDDTNAIVDNIAPVVTAAKISISGSSGTDGAYKIGDEVTAVWDNTASGDNNSDMDSVTVDFSAFGGGAAVSASNTSGTWKATYTIESGSIDGTEQRVSVTATDDAGNATKTDGMDAIVDNIAPVVTAAKISISGSSGTDGAYKIGDEVTAVWDNTASGDNNSDMDSVTVDFSAFGGGAAVPATNTSGTWKATYTIESGSIDGTEQRVSVTATDDAGNVTTMADETDAMVDNVAPVVAEENIVISGSSGTDGAYKIGDIVTAVWDNTASGDNNSDMDSVTVDFRAFGGEVVRADNSSNIWKATYKIIAGSIDGTDLNVSVTATDDAGNVTTTADETDATVDNVAPVVTEESISISGASGTDGTYRIGDVVTATWDNSASGDNNADIDSVTVDFRAFGGDATVVAIDSSGIWKATFAIVAGSIDGTDRNISVTAMDDVGNVTTTADDMNASVDNIAPVVTEENIDVSGATGTDGTYRIGDVVTAIWDNRASGDNNNDIDSVTVDFRAFGGEAAVVASHRSGIWTATYTLVSGSIDATGRNIPVTVRDDGGNMAKAMDATNATVDNITPVVTEENISISGATGTDGIYRIGDVVMAVWDNTSAGDNNSDMDSVTVDFSAFGGGTAVEAVNTSNVWKAAYKIITGSIDGTDKNVSIRATDDAGNVTVTADSTDAAVDNIAPVVMDGNIGISGATGTNGIYRIGDVVTATWDNSASGDNNGDIDSVTVDFRAFGGDSTVVASDNSGIWTATYIIVSGNNSGNDKYVSITVTDDAGNVTTTMDGTDATVDNASPAAPSSPDLATASDSGASSTDDLTNDMTPVMEGTAEAGATVTLYDTEGSRVLGTGIALDGNWRITSSALSEGLHTLTAVATDTAGNIGIASSDLKLRIDLTAPAVPTGFAAVFGDTKNELSWAAGSENDLASYTVYGSVATDPKDPLDSIRAGTTSYTHSGLSNGTTYYYQISAVDSAGNESGRSIETSAVPKAPQVITFAALVPKTYGDADFPVGARTSSGLALRYASDNTDVATIVDGNIHIMGAGRANITVSQTGNDEYTPANDQIQELTVNRKAIAVILQPVSKVYDGTTTASLTFRAFTAANGLVGADDVRAIYTAADYDNANVGMDKTVRVSGLALAGAAKANYSLSVPVVTGAVTPRTLAVKANAAQGKIYGEADPVLTYEATGFADGEDISMMKGALSRAVGEDVGTYAIGQGTLTAGANYVITYTGADFGIALAPQQGLAFPGMTVTYDGKRYSLAVQGLAADASVSYANNGQTEAGTYEVTATVTRPNYVRLVLNVTLQIIPAKRTLKFPALPEKTFGDSDFEGKAVASTREAVFYTSDNPEVATIMEGRIHIVGAGQTTITATVAGNGNYTDRPVVSRNLVVRKASQTITLDVPSEVSREAGAITINATSGSGLPVMLEVDDEQVATVSGTTLNILRLGTVRLTATQTGDDNYEAAEPVRVTVLVTNEDNFPVEVHKALSPNGDGINEFLMIEGIKDYPENKLTVVDRNGRGVFEMENYNDEDRVFRGLGRDNNPLPSGTYYYLLEVKVKGEWKFKKGYFVIRY